MQFPQQIFIDGALFDNREVGQIQVRNTLAAPYGQSFNCPICMRQWAVVMISGQPTHALNSFCSHHAIGEKLGTWNFGHIANYQVPGSLWLSYDDQWNSRLRGRVLEREFLLHYDAYFKDLIS